MLREEGEGVIAVCRWRACGSCWLWRLLYVRGWRRRRIGVRLWPCCSENPPLSRSHRLAWLQLDCGLRSPDPGVPRPLVLQAQKTNPSYLHTGRLLYVDCVCSEGMHMHNVGDGWKSPQTCCCKNWKRVFNEEPLKNGFVSSTSEMSGRITVRNIVTNDDRKSGG